MGIILHVCLRHVLTRTLARKVDSYKFEAKKIPQAAVSLQPGMSEQGGDTH